MNPISVHVQWKTIGAKEVNNEKYSFFRVPILPGNQGKPANELQFFQAGKTQGI